MIRLGFEVDDVEKVIEYCKNNNFNFVGIFFYLFDLDGNIIEIKNFILE